MKKWVIILLTVGVVAAFGQVWQVEVVDSNDNSGMFASLGIDSNNLPHIAYLYTFPIQPTFSPAMMPQVDGELRYAHYNGTNWTTEVVDDNNGDGQVGTYSSLAMSPATDRPHIAYFDAYNGHLKWARLNANGSWTIGIPDPNQTDVVGAGCSIVVDASDNAHISYWNVDSMILLYSTPDGGGGWLIDTVDFSDYFEFMYLKTSITLDDMGNPHIAYYVSDNATQTVFLKHAKLVTGTWIIDTVEYREGETLGLWPDIEIGPASNNLPYVSYFDVTNLYMKYARYNSVSETWSYGVVENTPGTGMYGTQVLGSSHASYYDENNGNLKYAYTEDYLGWNSEDVDTAGDVGGYTSIELSYKGDMAFPHIAYYDGDNHYLKYATKILKDMLPVSIDNPPRKVYPDSTYPIEATIRNQGNAVCACSVSCKITLGTDDVYIGKAYTGALNVDAETQVTFNPPTWTVIHGYNDVWYHIQVETELADDSVPDNDLFIDSIFASDTFTNEVSEDIDIALLDLEVVSGRVMLTLPAAADAELYLVDVSGRRRLTLHDGLLEAGNHEFAIDSKELGSGVYFVRLKAPDINVIRKTILVR
ncbi:hypothetical protein GF359_10840 [candidate division WOR-3 bacterium]|uniref:CARDB domain-containing protein n=1 Tax=candidate division WOR-3 bacterium TaxID=2052148 RepID=A0A9D5QDF1_UNCW3|nr:hypothetical protein [candidate division WOR-3 bacterium]MBD3365698.1 hypothetical protein [candidate division WOR-3 bacterium]